MNMMTGNVFLTHSQEKANAMINNLGFSDYRKHYNDDCNARKFKCRFEDKFGNDVYAWYDQSGTALKNWTPVFKWVD